jgi:hypothetical protein
MKTLSAFLVFVFLVALIVFAYASLCLNAVQPENHGALRYKVYGYLLIAATPIVFIGYFCWLVRRK